jgi:glycosyltransferase involved in cell wall biosynthesis
VSILARTGASLITKADEQKSPRPASAAGDMPIRVCMIAYTNYLMDGRVRREAEALASAGFHVTCLTPRNAANRPWFVIDGVEVREVAVPKYRGKRTFTYIQSYLRFLALSSAHCLSLLFKGRLDVVHAHNVPDFLVFAGLLPRLAGKKVVLDIHDSMPETVAAKFTSTPLLDRVLRLEERISALVAHRVVCVNGPQRDLIVSRGVGRSKTFVCMNVPDPRIFPRPDRSAVSPRPSQTFDLVYHGTMAERLGVDLIIRAVARVRERIPNVRLHLWGDGDDVQTFQQLARELDIADKVRFNPAGYPVHELAAHLGHMNVGLAGNRKSVACDLMLPVKLMECFSVGIPVVAPRLKTIQHYLSEEMVAYFEPEDVDSMARAILRLYESPEVRSRQVAKAAEFLEEYGWQRQGPELVDFYRDLVKN